MPSSDTVVSRLRSATSEAHQQLETHLDVIDMLRSGPERQRLIERYRRLYASAAILLAPWLDGVEGLTRPVGGPSGYANAQVEIHSRAEALGFRYVIEGSALGGRMILRELESLGVDTTELGFLSPHGARTGEVWRSFVSLLERELAAPPGALDQAVSGAVKGFAHARVCLSDGLPAA